MTGRRADVDHIAPGVAHEEGSLAAWSGDHSLQRNLIELVGFKLECSARADETGGECSVAHALCKSRPAVRCSLTWQDGQGLLGCPVPSPSSYSHITLNEPDIVCARN